MNEKDIQGDPYCNLPDPLVEELTRMAHSAKRITTAMVVAIFIPALFVFVMGFALLRIIQSKRITSKYAQLINPYAQFPNLSKSEVKDISLEHRNLKAVVEFRDARVSFWIALVFPVAFVGLILLVVNII